MSQRYFITAESTYEGLRQSLNTALAYPNALGKSVFQTALYAPRDNFRRVLLAVDTDLSGYAIISAAIAPLLDSDAIEEIDEATYLAALASATAGASAWNDITDKPSTFPPSAHAASHAATGSDPVTVTVAQVTGLQTALDGKQPAGSYAAAAHTHTLSAVTDAGTAASRNVPATGNASSSQVVLGSDTRLTDARTPASHSHGSVTSDGRIGTEPGLIVVTGAGGQLTTSGSLLGYATIHDVNIPDLDTVTFATDQSLGDVLLSVDSAIDGKASASHTHALSSLTQSGATSGQVVTWNGSAWAAATPATYSLPVATSSVLGGVIVGSGLSVSSGTVSANVTSVAGRTGAVTIAAADVSGLASVATSGAYSSLTGTPSTLPPTAGSVTDSAITSGGLSASSINWTAITPWAPSTAYAKGDLVSYLGVAYRRSAAGTSGSTFNTANWQQVTPSLFAVNSDTVGSTSYIGRAVSGSATSASVWTIRRTVLTSAGAVSATTTAANVKWDDRLTASYS